MSSSTPPQAPSSFPSFPTLPTELRARIWTLNLPSPRLVPLHYTAHHGATSPAPIPANLHTSTEARALALPHYPLCLALMHNAPKIFFDPHRDVLYFGARDGYMGSFQHFVHAVTLVERAELGRVRRLGVSGELCVSEGCAGRFWGYVREKFGGVEEVFVFVGKGRGNEGMDGDGDIDMDAHVKGDGNEGAERGLAWMIGRAVEGVEREYGWRAPKWEIVVMGELDGEAGLMRKLESRE